MRYKKRIAYIIACLQCIESTIKEYEKYDIESEEIFAEIVKEVDMIRAFATKRLCHKCEKEL